MNSNIAERESKNFQQVETPEEVVKFFWHLISKYKSSCGKVLDMGAGDGRFAQGGIYSSYHGIEIDKNRYYPHKLPQKASIEYGCVFEHPKLNYDACIGNPPYLKHNNIESGWREEIIKFINSELEILSDRRCNLYAYFACLGIIKTKSNGLIALIIPYEWVYIPSVRFLRDYINAQGWSIHVYRFKQNIFKRVETTASVTLIDKKTNSSEWHFYNVDSNFNISSRKSMLDSNLSLLKYEKRGEIWAMRGLSPGTKKVFTLSEKERISYNLNLNDVSPCVISLRPVPKNLRSLDKKSFKKYFIDAEQKCWLIRSDKLLSKQLKKYLYEVPEDKRNTSTCKNRDIWYAYRCHPSPKILYNPGFTKFGPKFLINEIHAIAVGSVHGIHSNVKLNIDNLQSYLLKMDFERRLVPHSGKLKKIEVRQMNSVLNSYSKKTLNS
jgi:predicted RNA methylase